MRRIGALLVLLLATPGWAACPIGDPVRDPAAIAEQIARGHAFEKHAREYRPGQMVTRNLRQPDAERRLARGRRAYWEEDFGGVVIFDPNNDDCGTAFRPRRGKEYFDQLR